MVVLNSQLFYIIIDCHLLVRIVVINVNNKHKDKNDN